MNSSLASWRLAFKLALRDMRRYKGRSFLAGLLIFVPVLSMAALLTGLTTANVDGHKETAQRLTAAAASVSFIDNPGATTEAFPAAGKKVGNTTQPTTEQVAQQAHAQVTRQTMTTVRLAPGPGTPKFLGSDDNEFLQTDLHSPLVRPTITLDSGRWPAKPGEVLVTRRGKIQGIPTHGTVTTSADSPLQSGTPARLGSLTIVGTATSTSDAALAGPPVPTMSKYWQTPEFLIAGKEWDATTIARWQKFGAQVSTRSVTPEGSQGLLTSEDSGVVVAIGTMGFIAVTALLAGPAFAASATRQRRTLGLIAANGATRAVLRRIILGQALVLGTVTALVAVVIGAGIGSWVGKWAYLYREGSPAPTDIPVTWLIALLVVSAVASLISAAVPARSAGRTNLLAALRGQVSSRVVRKRWPLIGLAGIGLGTLCLFIATARDGSTSNGENVLLSYVGVPLFFGGAVLAVPYFLLLSGRLARHLPVTARIAVRDVSRQRTRATASVGAVLATVAVLCATSIFGASIDAFEKKQYTPATSVGSGIFQAANGSTMNTADQHQAVTSLDSIREVADRATPMWTAVTTANIPRLTAGQCTPKSTTNDAYSGTPVVALDPADIATAGFSQSTQRLLSSGGGVVVRQANPMYLVNGQPVSTSRITHGSITLHDQDPADTAQGIEQRGCRLLTLKSSGLDKAPKHLGVLPGGSILISKATLDQLKLPSSLWAISLDPNQPLSKAKEHQLAALTPPGMTLQVEHGYRSKLAIILGAITAGFALIVLLTTIVSTLLNDAESQADMATLAATGAPRGMRRRIVGAHAAAIGFIGAMGGIAVGFIPGLVLARAATTENYDGGGGIRGTYAVAWWPLAAMLVLVPLVAALISMIFARRTPSLTRREA